MITWRDDDVLLPETRLEDLLEVDDMLRARGLTHTVAILAEALTPELAAVITGRGMAVQLHAWRHDDLSADVAAIAQLPAALDRIEALTGVRPTVLYPPWNRTNARLETAAAALGLRVSAAKISLDQFLRLDGRVPADTVINFHYWYEPERIALRRAVDLVARAA